MSIGQQGVSAQTTSRHTVAQLATGGFLLLAGETKSSVPPYLNLETFVATLVVAIAVYALGRLWGRERPGA
jgi:hypothetical protein